MWGDSLRIPQVQIIRMEQTHQREEAVANRSHVPCRWGEQVEPVSFVNISLDFRTQILPFQQSKIYLVFLTDYPQVFPLGQLLQGLRVRLFTRSCLRRPNGTSITHRLFILPEGQLHLWNQLQVHRWHIYLSYKVQFNRGYWSRK